MWKCDQEKEQEWDEIQTYLGILYFYLLKLVTLGGKHKSKGEAATVIAQSEKTKSWEDRREEDWVEERDAIVDYSGRVQVMDADGKEGVKSDLRFLNWVETSPVS